jgi:hypothetical protein
MSTPRNVGSAWERRSGRFLLAHPRRRSIVVTTPADGSALRRQMVAAVEVERQKFHFLRFPLDVSGYGFWLARASERHSFFASVA